MSTLSQLSLPSRLHRPLEVEEAEGDLVTLAQVLDGLVAGTVPVRGVQVNAMQVSVDEYHICNVTGATSMDLDCPVSVRTLMIGPVGDGAELTSSGGDVTFPAWGYFQGIRAWSVSATEHFSPPAWTVGTLPTQADPGEIIFAINGRNPGEGSGAGTGCLVVRRAGAWYSLSTNLLVTA